MRRIKCRLLLTTWDGDKSNTLDGDFGWKAGHREESGSLSGDTRLHQHMTEKGSWKSHGFSRGENKQILLYPNPGVETLWRTLKNKTSSELSGFVFLSVERWRHGVITATHFSNEPLKGTEAGNAREKHATMRPQAGCRGSLPCPVPQEQ